MKHAWNLLLNWNRIIADENCNYNKEYQSPISSSASSSEQKIVIVAFIQIVALNNHSPLFQVRIRIIKTRNSYYHNDDDDNDNHDDDVWSMYEK